MEIIKEKLADLEMVYSINMISINGTDYCIAAGEGREGKVALINCGTKRVQYVEGLSGGVMSILPVTEEKGAFYAIQSFYPVFQSEAAEIVKAFIDPGEDDVIAARLERIIPLPYVHRIWQGGGNILAATLCAEKHFEQDWSSPGQVYIVEPAVLPEGRAVKRGILDGIHKNHGMYEHLDSVLISGEEGVFELKRSGNEWVSEKWLSQCISDLCLFDIDGDGQDELITIAPFHGDRLQVYRKTGGQWTIAAEEALAFGHAVWAGKIDGIPCIIACSRGGEKETALFRVSADKNGKLILDGEIIDSGVGAANIVVRQNDGETALYAANHGINEVAKYSIKL